MSLGYQVWTSSNERCNGSRKAVWNHKSIFKLMIALTHKHKKILKNTGSALKYPMIIKATDPHLALADPLESKNSKEVGWDILLKVSNFYGNLYQHVVTLWFCNKWQTTWKTLENTRDWEGRNAWKMFNTGSRGLLISFWKTWIKTISCILQDNEAFLHYTSKGIFREKSMYIQCLLY